MSDIVIRAHNLSKRYQIGERDNYIALRDVIARAVSAPARLFRARNPQSVNGDARHIWALKDVSFEIRRGEVVGVIGRNGAGKSTLLKILARVTKPTTGHAEVRGRMGSLLEVGTGFHPELTGRENTYLNGAILGMSKKEVARNFDEIVAFAEIEKFIDTPVKHYSTGMYLRLAFAVAAHLETEILVVDEVLAVGDAGFQKKCLGKIGSVATQGRTVLFVSHSMAAVASLCTVAIMLDGGHVGLQGLPRDVISEYLTSRTNVERVDLRVAADRRGSGEIRIVEAVTRNAVGELCSSFKHGEDVTFEFTLEPTVAAKREMICVVWIKTATGVPVLHLASHDDPSGAPVVVDREKVIRCVLKNCTLYPGTYVVSFWTGPTHYHDTDLVMDALQFRVEQGPLFPRSYDTGWQHGIFHSSSYWLARDTTAPAQDKETCTLHA